MKVKIRRPHASSTKHLLTVSRTDLERMTSSLEHSIWRKDPVAWTQERLRDHLWSKQQEILRALITHRKVAAVTCHSIGKSFVAAIASGWWTDTGEWTDHGFDSFVVTSAPSAPQVRTILWREISRVHTRGRLPGRLNQTSWYLPNPKDPSKEEIVGMGRKPDEYEPTAFQGIHAPRVLVVFDEACGIRGSLWEAADSLTANDASRFLLIGNPDDPATEFAECCKPGSGWYVVNVGAFDSPNFTNEPCPQFIKDQLIGPLYVEEKRRKLAKQWIWNAKRTQVIPPPGLHPADVHPVWSAKVLGKFPDVSAMVGSLIPQMWITQAQERDLLKQPKHLTPRRLGVDVGGGGDSSTICDRRGGRFRIINEDHNPDTMQTTGNVVAALRDTGADQANVDVIGIGHGVVDRGKELHLPFNGVNVSEVPDVPEETTENAAALANQAPATERFINKRAQLYWQLREMFEAGLVDLDPQDEDTANELQSIRYRRTSSGKIQIESKDDAKRRGVGSPNRAESIMLSLAEMPAEESGFCSW